jgi:hypothetical protein
VPPHGEGRWGFATQHLRAKLKTLVGHPAVAGAEMEEEKTSVLGINSIIKG